VKWVIAAISVAAATVAATTALLLGYSGSRNDPVGRLSPVANTARAVPAAAPTSRAGRKVVANGDEGRHSDD
jgi:hypothetical protein